MKNQSALMNNLVLTIVITVSVIIRIMKRRTALFSEPFLPEVNIS